MSVARLLAAAALAAAAAPALAADPVEREALLAYAANDVTLQIDVHGRILVWADELLDPASPPPAWDAQKLGPWDVVVRRAGRAFEASTPGRLWLMVSLDPEGLPSGAATADALAGRLVEGFRAKVEERARDVRRPAEAAAQRSVAAATDRRDLLVLEMRMVEEPHGGPPAQRAASTATRLAAAETDLASARVERAVTAKKLEAARAGAQRAVELARLRAEADEVERALRDRAFPPERAAREKEEAALRDKLAALRRAIDEATARCPSLETARERVFDLEVALVGLETREAVLAEEIRALREAAAALAPAVRKHEELARKLSSAMHDVAVAEMELAAASRPRPGPVFEAIRNVSPVRKKEK
jgi:hypothetical protein